VAGCTLATFSALPSVLTAHEASSALASMTQSSTASLDIGVLERYGGVRAVNLDVWQNTRNSAAARSL